MANYPTGISLNGAGQFAVILELTDTPINTPVGGVEKLGFGYIRQRGVLADGWTVDEFVQYDPIGLRPFKQAGITYAYIEAKYLLFVQSALS